MSIYPRAHALRAALNPPDHIYIKAAPLRALNLLSPGTYVRFNILDRAGWCNYNTHLVVVEQLHGEGTGKQSEVIVSA